MTLREEDRNALVKHRLERAIETMNEVNATMQLQFWRIAANRLYYACYYAASAPLIKHGISTNSHRGVSNQLGLYFISKGLVSSEHGKLLKHLFELRQTGDYDDWIDIEEENIIHLVEPAQKFIQEMERLINLNRYTQ